MIQIRGVQETRPLHSDVHECGLHARKHPGDAALVDVADDPFGVGPLHDQLHQFAVFEHGDADLVGRRVDDHFFLHKDRPPPEGVLADQMPAEWANVESYRDYVFGTRDGVPKTPEWAERGIVRAMRS